MPLSDGISGIHTMCMLYGVCILVQVLLGGGAVKQPGENTGTYVSILYMINGLISSSSQL